MSDPSPNNEGARLKVFISYSRKDREFADELLAALETCGFDAYLDRQDIAPGEAWEARLTSLIREADTIIYVVSPASIASTHCSWEVAETQRMAKRLVPVVCAPVDDDAVPPSLKRLNYIYFDKPHAFGGGLAQLVRALNTDLAWLRDHTHLLEEATRWDLHGHAEALLLRGTALDEARDWQSRRPKHAPEPTALQLDFISQSIDAEERRNSRERQQIAEMALANDTREKALRKASDTLKEMADVLRRRARARAIAGAVMFLLAGVAVAFGIRAEQQRTAAEHNEKLALDVVGAATKVFVDYQDEFNDEAKKSIFRIFRDAADTGSPQSMYNLAASYLHGLGTPVDRSEAETWFAKASEHGYADGYCGLGILASTRPEGPDRELARKHFGKALSLGSRLARALLDQLAVKEDVEAARYVDALAKHQALIEWLERESATDGAWAKRMAEKETVNLVWYAILAKDFPKALAVAESAHGKRPTDLAIEINRAHALMLSGRDAEARAIYRAHKGAIIPVKPTSVPWDQAVASDFNELRKLGIERPLMDDVIEDLGLSRPGDGTVP